jgi:1,2-diacylglycerol 3-beta-galactosyltransferase
MKIVFAMIEAGGGHKAPARAVLDALQEIAPGRHEARMMDFMKDLGCTRLDTKHKAQWDWLLAHPRLTRVGFRAANLFPRLTDTLLTASYVRPFQPFVERFLREERPDVVFCTHFFAARSAVRAARETVFPCRVVTLCSDPFVMSAFWTFAGSDLYIVGSAAARDALIRWGHPGATVEIHPYPVSPAFFRTRRPSAVVRHELALRADTPTLLVSFGGQGIGDVERYLHALADSRASCNVLVITGRNAALKERLDRTWKGRRGPLTTIPLGYVTNMNELLEVSNACFIKPGAAATMEAMAARRPIIFADSAAGNEEGNVRCATALGVGIRAGRSLRRFLAAWHYFAGPEGQAAAARAYQAQDAPSGAQSIARRLDTFAAGPAVT